MASTAEHGMKRIAQVAAQPVSAQQPFIFHVTDHRFDSAAPFDALLEPRGDTAPHSIALDLNAGHFSPLIALVYKAAFGFLVVLDGHLFNGFTAEVLPVRVLHPARSGLHPSKVQVQQPGHQSGRCHGPSATR